MMGMMMKERLHAVSPLITLILFVPTLASAQLTVAPQTDLEVLVNSLEGQGVRIENPTIQCHSEGFGSFFYNGSLLGASEGVLLTTGRITNAVGPNNVQNRTFQQNTPGDPLLNIATGRTTYDACKLEFDLIPSGDSINFDVVFGSEEYNEWVGSQYNDVFGFFISGPGIVGDPGMNGDKNIALVPGTSLPVSINTVNNGSNTQYYYDNTGGQHIQYDGFTHHLKAHTAVAPCQTYHMKIIVADASDRQFDSGLFIQKIKSNNITIEAFTLAGIPELVEGCNPGHIRFARPQADPDPLIVEYYITGTATNGVDIEAIGDPDPLVAKQAVIPAGGTYVDVAVVPIADGITEVDEHLRFILGNPLCPSLSIDSVDMVITDVLPASVVPGNVSICSAGSMQFQASGGDSYSWSPATGLSATNIASPIASPSTTTTYTVTITKGDCTRSFSRTVTVNSMSLSAVTTRPLCHGQNNGAINLSIAGGTPPFAFAWSGPNGSTFSTEDLVNIPAGTYTITVTDAMGCVRTQSFNLTSPSVLSASTTTTMLTYGQNIACHGTSTGNIGLNVTGGTAPYSYAWTGPANFSSTGQNLSNVPAGDYLVTVTDANGCTTTASRSLTQPPQLLITFDGISHVTCNGANDGSATAVVTGGIPPYSYSWNTSPVQTLATSTGLGAGTRTVTITDGYGCATTGSVVITQPNTLSAGTQNVSHILECQGGSMDQGSATAVASGGTPPYTYAWNTTPPQSGPTAGFTVGGTYTATITDANGCMAGTSVNIAQPGISAIEMIAQTDVLCAGANTGSITVGVNGPSSAQSIVWNTQPPQYGSTLSNLSAGTYNGLAQHANGCQSNVSVTISEPDGPLGAPLVTSGGSVICFGDGNGNATLDAQGGTAPYTFSYNGTPLAGNEVTGLSAGTHTILVTDAHGCTSQGPIEIDGPGAALQVSITGYTNELCFGGAQGTASAMATGGTPPYTYEWNTEPVQSGADATDLPQGTYTVTVTDLNGCTASANVTIGGPQFGIDGMIEDQGNVSCYGANDGWATILVTGGSNSFTITWNTEPPQYGNTATGLAPGQYEVVVLDNNGCDDPKYLYVAIEGPQMPLTHTIAISDHNGWNVSCAGASDGWLDLTIEGGNAPYNIVWSDEYGNSTGIEDPVDLDAGIYYLNISDTYGCTIQDTVVLNSPEQLLLEFELSLYPGGANTSCSGTDDGSIDMSVSGGIMPYMIQWSNNQGFNATTEDITGLAAGSYDVLVTDANGCTASATVELAAPEVMELHAALSEHNGFGVSCFDSDDGTIDLSVTGGDDQLTFLWSNGAMTEDLNGVGAGTYDIMVTDVNGCSASATYTLTAPPALVTDINVAAAPGGYGVSCTGATDGAITATIQGGVPGYDVDWAGPGGFTSNSLDQTDLAAGTYTLTISDANGCVTQGSVQITEPAPVSIGLASTSFNGGHEIPCHGAGSGSINTSITGGVGGYDIVWSGPDGYSSTDQDPTDLQPGTYDIQVTDANGCQAQASITLDGPDPLEPQVSAADIGGGWQVGCAGNEGSITLSVTGGTPEYQYSWTGPNGFGSIDQDLAGLGAGTYTVTITDANGCSIQSSITLEAAPSIAAQFDVTDNTCPGGSIASINSTITGGSGNYAFDWTGPAGFHSIAGNLNDLEAGSYTLEVTDDLGCSATFPVVVNDPAPLASGTYVSFYGIYNLQCVGDSSGVIELDPTGGTGPYEVNVLGPGGNVMSGTGHTGLIAGDYLVSITDQNGCAMDTLITLTEPENGIAAEFTVSQYPSGHSVSCHGGSDGWIEATIIGGNGPYVVVWRGPDSLEWEASNIYDLPAGDYAYELVVIDANQCTFSTEITLDQPEEALELASIASIYNGYNVSCPDAMDGSIDMTIAGGSPGYDITWTGPAGYIDHSEDISSLAAGAYTATVNDINGCVAELTVQIIPPPQLIIGLAANSVDCFGNETGVVQADVSGGAGTFSYSWSGPGIAADAPLNEVTGLAAGTYCLNVVDDNGCSTQECVTIISPTVLAASISTTADECGTNTGSISMEVSGGTMPYTYQWSNGAATQDVTDLMAGNYSVVIMDANGCTLGTTATIAGTPMIIAGSQVTHIACNGGETGAIDLNITHGTAPFNVVWQHGADTEDITNLSAGIYTALITDASGCTLDTQIEVLESDGIVLTTTLSLFTHGHNISHFGGSDGSIAVDVNGGTPPYQFTWSTGQDQPALDGLPAGTYTLEVTDALGCNASLIMDLTEPMELEMPTGYSPNGDGANDVFFIRGLDAFPANTFTVFNRWGNVVYDRLNYRNDWAGEAANGEPLPDGTYFVILTVEQGSRTLQGYVDMRR